jgi:hypothetical protein
MIHDEEETELLDEKTGSSQPTETVVIQTIWELPVLSDEEILSILNYGKANRNQG